MVEWPGLVSNQADISNTEGRGAQVAHCAPLLHVIENGVLLLARDLISLAVLQ
ncbi:hypothetical protein [Nostoc commune]|uniref:hypothetical protein n=1 Tax=Nostoc commune TaxID=1178 RepID=UPI002074A952|nr:hypothetical protein [Nostoc commune]